MTKARNIADLGSNDVIETTSTGVDVTGTVTADGLTVDGGSTVDAITYTNSSDFPTTGVSLNANGFSYEMVGSQGKIFRSAGNTKALMEINDNNDLHLYEDTGTTAKFVWDSSAENLSINSSGAFPLSLDSTHGETILKLDNSSTNGRRYWLISGGSSGSFAGGKFGVYDADSLSIPFLIDSSGNVGIGTASPSRPLDVHGGTIGVTSSTAFAGLQITSANNSFAYVNFGDSDDGNIGQIRYDHLSNAMVVTTNNSERARITSSGSFLINTSGVLTYGDAILQSNGGSNNWGATFESSATSASRGAASFVVQNTGAPLARFHYVSTSVGDITTNGTAVSYGSNSDYRLKENVTTITDASERLKALKPCRFNFISHPDKTVDGFLAHEAQEVVPEAVTGTKDAMRTEEYEVTPAVEATYDEDGNELTPAVEAVMGTREVPDYQGIDQSKLVPLLTKALQEALTRIEALENANGNS